MHSTPLIYRLLLLVLLPGIAVIIYFRGQHYDSALIDFKETSGQKSSSPALSAQSLEKPFSPPQGKDIAGFRQTGREQRYTKDNLYEHVNGHAEYFISAGFVELTVTEYFAVDSKSAQTDMQAEVFDMGKSIQAYGVLSDESGEHAQSVSVGTMAFKTSGGINFIKGRYYVKISALSPKAPLLKFARDFSLTLPASRDSFEIFSRFPDIGKAGKTRFIKEGYRGLDFLRNVVEREYSAGGRKITVALMTGSSQEIKTLESVFFDYFRKSGMRYEKTERNGQEFYRVMDKYEGNWFLIPSGDALFGVFGTEDEAAINQFVKGKD